MKRACPICRRSFPELDSRLFSYNATAGACPTCSGYGFVTETIRKAVRKGIAFRDELGDSDDEGSQSQYVQRFLFPAVVHI